MVAHCGKSVAGSHAHLVLTDIASGWTEATTMVVREQTLITLTVEEVRGKLSFPILSLDVDTDSAFIHETVLGYRKERKIELTRSRAYKKNVKRGSNRRTAQWLDGWWEMVGWRV